MLNTSLLRFAKIASLALGAAALAAPALAAPLPSSGQFDEVSTVSSDLLTVKVTKTITFKGDNFRIDSKRMNFERYSRIQDGGAEYSYLPDEQTAMRALAKDKPPSLPSQLQSQTSDIVHAGTKSGTETVLGFACDIYSQPSPDGGDTTVKVWVSKDPRFPFVVKTLSVNHKQGVTDTEEVQNVHVNTPISDTAFALPKDTKVVDAPPPGASDNSGAASPADNGAPSPAAH